MAILFSLQYSNWGLCVLFLRVFWSALERIFVINCVRVRVRVCPISVRRNSDDMPITALIYLGKVKTVTETETQQDILSLVS